MDDLDDPKDPPIRARGSQRWMIVGLLVTAMLGLGLGYGYFAYARLGPTVTSKRPPSTASSPVGALAGNGGEAQRWLLGGNAFFKGDGNPQIDLSGAKRKSLVNEQRPSCAILACADSRVPPEHIFKAGLGQLFTFRVLGNVVDAVTLGSIEHAVEQLGTELVVVMGHEGCWAVKAARSENSQGASLDIMLSLIRPGIAGIVDHDLAVRKNIHNQVAALLKSEKLEAKIALGELTVMAAYYHLESGEVSWLETPSAAGAEGSVAKPAEPKPADAKKPH